MLGQNHPSSGSPIGAVVAGKYRLIRELGVGGMGTVFEAEHVLTRMRTAVKLFHTWVVAEYPPARRRFIEEAQAPASIGHPAIVSVLDAGEEQDGRPYLVFELLNGRSLASVLESDPISIEQAVWIAREVLDALSAAHQRGIVHRDIKPENVFLEQDAKGAPRIRLLDFGIAKRVARDDTSPGMVLGSDDYMSPEQEMGEPIDFRTDLYAVGALLFRCLAGETAKNAARREMKAIAAAEWLAAREVPAELASLIERALAREPDRRFKSAGDMRELLRPFSPRAEQPTVPFPKLEPPSDRREASPTLILRPKVQAPAPMRAPAFDPRATHVETEVRSERKRSRKVLMIFGAAGLLLLLAGLLLRQDEEQATPATPTPAPLREAPAIEPPPLPERALEIEAPIERSRKPEPKKRIRKKRFRPPESPSPAKESEPWDPKLTYE